MNNKMFNGRDAKKKEKETKADSHSQQRTNDKV
jgi:hypothetical protein